MAGMFNSMKELLFGTNKPTPKSKKTNDKWDDEGGEVEADQPEQQEANDDNDFDDDGDD